MTMENGMTITDTMKQRLAALDPSHLDLIDDSYKHAGHGTGEAGVPSALPHAPPPNTPADKKRTTQ